LAFRLAITNKAKLTIVQSWGADYGLAVRLAFRQAVISKVIGNTGMKKARNFRSSDLEL
jgi:hypothetical protein